MRAPGKSIRAATLSRHKLKSRVRAVSPACPINNPDEQQVSTKLQNNERKRRSISRDPIGAPTNRTIYVRVIIDADSILRDHPDPLKDAETPTTVSFDAGQMIVTTTVGTADQGTGDITFNACAGDTVRFYAKSGSNNFELTVLIQDIRQTENDEILEGFELVNLPQTGIAPASDAGEQTAEPVEQQFWFWQCAIAGEGTQTVSLILVLYDRDEDGQPRFAGLYRWDLQLTVQSSPLPPDANTQNQERTP